MASVEAFPGHGYESLEDAARGDIPRRFATVVGSRVRGELGTVWLLANDAPPFEPYEVHWERKNGRWYWDTGYGGFSHAPAEVLAEARRHGWS